MDASSDRLGIPANSGGNAHFFAQMASHVSENVEQWRAEVPKLWKPRHQKLDVALLEAFFARTRSMGLDPRFAGHVILGFEWVFRTRPLSKRDIESDLDEIQEKLRRSPIAEWKPWLASLIVGAAAKEALKNLHEPRYLVSLGQWATPEYDWRHFLDDDRTTKRDGQILSSSKSGAVPRLGPILASLIIERIAEIAHRRRGSKALALELASLLLKRRVQPGEFNVWRRAVRIPAPDRPTGMTRHAAPPDLHDWLVQRSISSYDIAFAERGRDWAEYTHELTHNPLALFAPLADLEVIALLYSLSWFHEVSRSDPKTTHP